MTSRPAFYILLSLICIAAAVSCWPEDVPPTPPMKGAVMRPGQRIVATNRSGQIQITYVSPTQRKYEFGHTSRIVDMQVRPEPFMGKQGLYDPADCFIMFCPSPRMVVEESVIDFDSEAKLYEFLYVSSAVFYYVYTGDGLVVGFGALPSRQSVNIGVWQLLLHGKKPSNLKGARPAAIRLISG